MSLSACVCAFSQLIGYISAFSAPPREHWFLVRLDCCQQKSGRGPLFQLPKAAVKAAIM
jgi:hypothetical protein